MKITFLIIFALLGFVQSNPNCDKKTMTETNTESAPTPPKQTVYDRLPDNLTLDREVKNDVVDRNGKVVSSEITTIEKTLQNLKARYKNDRLVDAKGREIKFFFPFCQGVSMGYEEDRKAQEEKAKELAELKKKYTVIVIYCDPTQVV